MGLFGIPKVFGDLLEAGAGEVAGAAGGIVHEVTDAFVSATQDSTTIPSTTPTEPASTTVASPTATTVTASSTEPAVVTVTETSEKQTDSSTVTATSSESEGPTSTESVTSETPTPTGSHTPEETTTASSSDSETPDSTTSDSPKESSTVKTTKDDSEETPTSVTTSDDSEETQKAKKKPEDDAYSDSETSDSTTDDVSQQTNNEAEDQDSSDTKKTSSTADKASQKKNSEAEDGTSSDNDEFASSADDTSHKTDSEAEDQTSSDTDSATSSADDASQQTGKKTKESTSSDSDTNALTSSDESQGTTTGEAEDATSSNPETADSTGLDASPSSSYESNTSGSGTATDASGSDSYADAVAPIDASGSEAQGGTIPIASVAQPAAYQDYSDQNYALLKPRLATSILMALSTISGFAVSPSPTYNLDASPASTTPTISHVSSVSNDLGKRWDGPTTLTTKTSPSSISDALGAMTALTTYTTCAPGQGCHGLDGTFIALASISTDPTPCTTSDDVSSTPTDTSAYSSTSPAPSHTPLAVMYNKRGLPVRRCDDSAAPYPTPDPGSNSYPTDVIDTAKNGVGGIYTAGTAGSFPTAAMDTDYLVPAATGDVKKRWQEGRRRWTQDVDLHSRQPTALKDVTASVGSENLKRAVPKPKDHPPANSDGQSPKTSKPPSTFGPSSPKSKQSSSNGKGQQSSPVDVSQNLASGSKAAGQKGTKASSPYKNQNGLKFPLSPKSGTPEFAAFLRSLPAIGPNDPDLAYAVNGYRPQELRERREKASRAKASGEASGKITKNGKQGQKPAPGGASASKKSFTTSTPAKNKPTRKSDRKGLARRNPANPTRSNSDPNNPQPDRSSRQSASTSSNSTQANAGSAPASGNAANTGSPNRRRFGSRLIPDRWRDRGTRRTQSGSVEEPATGNAAGSASGASQENGPPAYDNVHDDPAPDYSSPPSYHTQDDSNGSNRLTDSRQALQASQRPPRTDRTPVEQGSGQSEEDLMGLQRVRMPADTTDMSMEDFEDPSGGRGTSSQGSGGGTRESVPSNSQASGAGADGQASYGPDRQSGGDSSASPGDQGPSSQNQQGGSSQPGTTGTSGRASRKRSLPAEFEHRTSDESRSKIQRKEASEFERIEAKEGETSTIDRLTVPNTLTRRSSGGSRSKPDDHEGRRKQCQLSKSNKKGKGKGKYMTESVPDEDADCDLEPLKAVKHAKPDYDPLNDHPSSLHITPPMSKQKQAKDSEPQQDEQEASDPDGPYAPPKRPPTPDYPPKNAKPSDFGLDKWSDLTPEEGRRLMIKEQLAEIYPDDSMESFHPPKYPSSLAPPKPGTNPWTGDRVSQDGQDAYTPPGSMSSSIHSDVSESKYVPDKQEGETRKPGSKPPKRHRLLRRTDRRPPANPPSYEEANRGSNRPSRQSGTGRNQPPTPEAGPSNPGARPGSSRPGGAPPAASSDDPPDYTGQYHPDQGGRKDVADQRTGAPSPGSWYSGSDSYQAAPNYGVPDATSQANRAIDEEQDFWARHGEQYQNPDRFNVRAGRSRSNSRSRAGSQTGSQSGSEDGFEGTYRAGSPGPVPAGNLHRQRPAHDTTLDSNMRFTSRHSSRPGAQMMGSPVGMPETLPAHVPERPRQRQGVARPATPGVIEEPGDDTRPSRPVTPDPNSPVRGQTGHRIDREPGSGFRGTTRGRQGSRVYTSGRTSRGGERQSGDGSAGASGSGAAGPSGRG